MKRFHILIYKTADNYIEKRAPHRSNHLNLVKQAMQEKQIIMGGALDNPANEAFIVFNEASVAEAFAKNDPYVKNGAVKEWLVRPWNVFTEMSDFKI